LSSGGEGGRLERRVNNSRLLGCDYAIIFLQNIEKVWVDDQPLCITVDFLISEGDRNLLVPCEICGRSFAEDAMVKI